MSTQNNYNWQPLDLFTIYANLSQQSSINLTGLTGCCTTGSGLTIYCTDESGYLLIIQNSGTITNPIFTYSYINIQESNNVEVNTLTCSSNGDYIIFNPSNGNNGGSWYLIDVSNNYSITSLTSNFQNGVAQSCISSTGQYIGITSGGAVYISNNYGQSFSNLYISQQNTLSCLGMNSSGEWLYIIDGVNISIYDFTTKSKVENIYTITLPSNVNTNNPMFSIYTDYSGQYSLIPIFVTSNPLNIVYIDNYDANNINNSITQTNINITLPSTINPIPQYYINNTNNSLGGYLILSTLFSIYTSVPSSSTSSAIFTQEQYFTTLQGFSSGSSVATNACDSTNNCMAIVIGAPTNNTNIFNTLYYGSTSFQ